MIKPRDIMARWRRLPRLTRSLAAAVVIVYLVVGFVLDLMQTKMIFIGAETQGTSEAKVHPPRGTELVHLTAQDGTPIVGLFGPAMAGGVSTVPAAMKPPTVLFFYGNAMCMAYAMDDFALFRASGANCMLADYEGFGMSGGKPSENGCYQAAEAAYQHLLTRPEVGRIIPAGWSLGGAVAIDLASRHTSDQRISGLMTFSAFTSMAEMARYHYPIFPTSLILQHRFLVEEKLRALNLPYLLGHGRNDSIVPFRMADRLAAAARGPVTRITLDSDHNDFFAVGAEELREALPRFLSQL